MSAKSISEELAQREKTCPHLFGIDGTKVSKHTEDDNITRIMRTCCLIEAFGDDYSGFLEEIFSSDPELKDQISEWGKEETYHGVTLNWYLKRAFPENLPDRVFDEFSERVALYPGGSELFRNNKTDELISRCVVESATSTLYFSISDRTSEPIIGEICTRLARDEIKHYSLFFKNAKISNLVDKTTMFGRLKYVAKRFMESDGQLALAYYYATLPNRKFSESIDTSKFIVDLYKIYNFDRILALVKLNMKCIFLEKKPPRYLIHASARIVYFAIKSRILINNVKLLLFRASGEIV
jgi:hypothetical protein